MMFLRQTQGDDALREEKAKTIEPVHSTSGIVCAKGVYGVSPPKKTNGAGENGIGQFILEHGWNAIDLRDTTFVMYEQ